MTRFGENAFLYAGVRFRPPGPETTRLIKELLQARRTQKLTQQDIVDLTHKHWGIGVIQKVETGNATPSVELLAHWAQALGYQLALIPKEESPWPNAGPAPSKQEECTNTAGAVSAADPSTAPPAEAEAEVSQDAPSGHSAQNPDATQADAPAKQDC